MGPTGFDRSRIEEPMNRLVSELRAIRLELCGISTAIADVAAAIRETLGTEEEPTLSFRVGPVTEQNPTE